MKAKRRFGVILSVFLLLSLCVGLVGCGNAGAGSGSEAAGEAAVTEGSAAQEAESGKITIVDSRGVTVELDEPADEIVCLLNSGLNDLLMLGCGDSVIGIDEWTYTNEVTYNVISKLDDRIAAKEIPAVDSNIEQIISMNPDVVIIWAQDDEKIAALEENGIPVIGIQVNSFDEVYDKMRIIAKAVGKEERGEELIQWSEDSLASISDKVNTLEDDQKKSGIFVWGASKLDLAGKTSTGHSMLELCGVKDCAEGIEEEHFVAKLEDVIQWNPDAILMWNIADIDPQDYLDDSQWSDVTAIQNEDVYEIPDDKTFYCDMWTVKYVYGAQYFAKCAYPELFEDLDMDTFQNDMMMTLYGKTAE